MTRLAVLFARLGPDPRADGTLLLAFLADRDEAAFAELVRRHGPTVWGVCRRTLPDPADAEDAFQATFLVLLRRARGFDPGRCVGPWLYRVAVLTSRGLRRKNARRRTLPLADVPARPEPPVGDVDALLLRLPERERAAVVLCHLHGLTQREAADKLGVPEWTLSARLSRGLAKLRRHGPLAMLTAAVPATVAEAAVTVATAGRAAGPGVGPLVTEVLRMFWLKKLATAGLAVALVGGFGVGLGVVTRAGPVAVAADPPAVAPAVPTVGEPPPADVERGLRELEKQRQALDAQERALADRRRELNAQVSALRAKLDPKLAGPAFEFVIDRKDANGPIRLDERDDRGRIVTRTYFPSFRLDDISPLHHPLRRAREAGGPRVLRITSDRVPWDEYANSVAAASHDCGYFPEEGYGKKAEAIMFAKPDRPKP